MTQLTSLAGRLEPHARGHLLLFDQPPDVRWTPSNGLRLLLIVLVFEGVLGPRLERLTALGMPVMPTAIRYAVLIAIVCALANRWARVPLASLGLRPWRRWTLIEKSYLIQGCVLASVVFLAMGADAFREVMTTSALWLTAVPVLVGSLLFGFYQELIYRGLLQSELVRRWGTTVGIVVANTLYTLGPLHSYYWTGESVAIGMLAAIFAIGLFFSVVFHRSRNLLLVGIFHGVGNWFGVGLPRVPAP